MQVRLWIHCCSAILAMVTLRPPPTAWRLDDSHPPGWWEEVVAGQRSDCGWVAPVGAPVVDPFRAPGRPYGPGNRGIEYGTVIDEPVVAVADGRVTFVGPVAGRRYLVVSHPGGLRSTYGPLAAVLVVRGQVVGAGELVARADEGLHLTARSDDRYLDPQPLLDGRCLGPRLVPVPVEATGTRG
jgi:murein DD-endopeptidase MepM/ murein hydrolase activator NlpD